MLPTRKEAMTLLRDGLSNNPGPWGKHSLTAAHCAEKIAAACGDMDAEKAYVLGLLHDIGRKEQFENPGLCHARVGGDKAYAFLVGAGWTQERALRVKQAVAAHRYRSDNPPESIEAKILFDADKLDVTGAVGIARTLLYKGKMGQPLYTLQSDGSVSDGMELSLIHISEPTRP